MLPSVEVKLVTMLFYLPPDESQRQYGTSVLVPKDKTAAPNPGPHSSLDGWDQFHTVFTAPYVPNSLMSFCVTADSWHAVDAQEEQVERKSIQYFICADRDR